MGIRLSKSIRLGKLIRLNISKAGVGGSIGLGPLRIGTGPRGGRLSFDLPGAGISYVKQLGGGKSESARRKPARKSARRASEDADAQAGAQQAATHELPSPGFFAPRHEKELHRALVAYAEGRTDEALAHFLAASEEEPSAAVYAAALLAQKSEGVAQAVALLERVVQSDAEIPTPLAQKYLGDVRMPVRVTPGVTAHVPLDGLAATLLLVELYQAQGRLTEAVGLLEEVEELANHAALKLSLCELYAAAGFWDGVVERAKGTQVADDLTLELATLYGRAMQEKNLHEAAVAVFTDALKKKKGRSPQLVREAAYCRALSYEQLGRRAQANKELQKLYAEAPDFRDVAARLSADAPK
ncbi:MAG TPA: DUF4236 domain-containing protein [Pyrinomonadaceae bacterium]|nr:DUF4236 domain-containing protein [Pyrinomonadaceae bacterium]